MQPPKQKIDGGFSKMPNAIARCPNISARAFRVLGYLISLHPAYPSYSRIRKATGLSNETISKGIKELIARRVINYARGGPARGSNLYCLRSQDKWDLTKNNPDTLRFLKMSMSEIRNEVRQFTERDKTNLKILKNKTKAEAYQRAVEAEPEFMDDMDYSM